MKFLVLAILCHVALGYVDYSGDSVLRITANDLTQLKKLQHLEEKYDLWHEAREVGGHADVHVTQSQKEHMTMWLKEGGFQWREMIPDVGELISAERQARSAPHDPRNLDFYRTLTEIGRAHV